MFLFNNVHGLFNNIHMTLENIVLQVVLKNA